MLEFQTAEKAGGGYRQKQDEQALRQAGHRYATGFLTSARVPGTHAERDCCAHRIKG
jgi:hypothetical protein